jgi:hypothetical protein
MSRAQPPHFVEQIDDNDVKINNNNNINSNANNSNANGNDDDGASAATSFLTRFLASFTACFGTALAPVAPLAARASDLAEPYFGTNLFSERKKKKKKRL